MDRHRLAWLSLKTRTDLFDGAAKRMLHVAPEPALEEGFNRVTGLDHFTADLLIEHAMVRMDTTRIQFPGESFDVIYRSQVMEHVPEDRKAMRELHRVLRPGRWAVLMVPITVDVTVEDPDCCNPKERERRFGQHDHVRR